MLKYEEHREFPLYLGWAILLALSIGLVAWCMVLMMLIPDVPRQWDFGQLPDVPGESVYSTLPPPVTPVLPDIPRNMPPLPEARRAKEGYLVWPPPSSPGSQGTVPSS